MNKAQLKLLIFYVCVTLLSAAAFVLIILSVIAGIGSAKGIIELIAALVCIALIVVFAVLIIRTEVEFKRARLEDKAQTEHKKDEE